MIKRAKESKRNMNEDPIRGKQQQQKQRKKAWPCTVQVNDVDCLVLLVLVNFYCILFIYKCLTTSQNDDITRTFQMVVAVVGQSLRFYMMWQTRQKPPTSGKQSTEPANKQIVSANTRTNTQRKTEREKEKEKNGYRKHSNRQKEAPRNTMNRQKKVFLFLSSDMKCREQKSRVYIRIACLNERREY